MSSVTARMALQCGHCGREIYSSPPEGYERGALREAMLAHGKESPECRGLMPREFLEKLQERWRIDAALR